VARNGRSTVETGADDLKDDCSTRDGVSDHVLGDRTGGHHRSNRRGGHRSHGQGEDERP